jgi:hypothetical protein
MAPNHYSQVLEEMREDLSVLLKKAEMPDRNIKGLFTLGVSSKLRGIGVIAYLVEKDVKVFRSSLVESAKWRAKLFDRFDAGDPISPSLVSMHTYKELYDALASGDMGVARAFAERMGGRREAEQEHDRAFEIAMGYALKAILAEDDVVALARLADLEQACQHKDYVNFAGYVPVLRAIVSRDSAAAEVAFPELLSGHRRESKGQGLFSDTEDEFLCVWGVGLLNLAHARGMDVKVDDPLIPMELVM